MTLTPAMREALRQIADADVFQPGMIPRGTFDALRRRGLVEVWKRLSMSVCYWHLTPAGRKALEEQT